MIKLSLENINATSPYEVVFSASQDYLFTTSLGIHYLISFDDDQPLGGCPTFQFVIQKMENVRSPHDPKVEQTILAIVNEFFVSNLNVMLYMCDDSDGREDKRNRLFLSWFEKNAEPGRFTIRTAHAIIDEKGFYAAIIVENRNPLLQAIIEDFEQAAQVLTAGKPQ